MVFSDKEISLLREKFTYKLKKNLNNSKNEFESTKVHENSDLCSVCFNDFQNEDLMVDLPGCLHKFHFHCSKPW